MGLSRPGLRQMARAQSGIDRSTRRRPCREGLFPVLAGDSLFEEIATILSSVVYDWPLGLQGKMRDFARGYRSAVSVEQEKQRGQHLAKYDFLPRAEMQRKALDR